MDSNSKTSKRVWCGFLMAALVHSTAEAQLKPTGNGPKYGPNATRLHDSRGYFRNHSAPDFWSLNSNYVGQFNDVSCSVASAVMVINAARESLRLTAADELVNHKILVSAMNNPTWNKDGGAGHALNLDDYGRVLEKALRLYGFPRATTTVVHVTNTHEQVLRTLEQDLAKNEESDRDFIIAN